MKRLNWFILAAMLQFQILVSVVVAVTATVAEEHYMMGA
jgi:hypothetical protein